MSGAQQTTFQSYFFLCLNKNDCYFGCNLPGAAPFDLPQVDENGNYTNWCDSDNWGLFWENEWCCGGDTSPWINNPYWDTEQDLFLYNPLTGATDIPFWEPGDQMFVLDCGDSGNECEVYNPFGTEELWRMGGTVVMDTGGTWNDLDNINDNPLGPSYNQNVGYTPGMGFMVALNLEDGTWNPEFGGTENDGQQMGMRLGALHTIMHWKRSRGLFFRTDRQSLKVSKVYEAASSTNDTDGGIIYYEDWTTSSGDSPNGTSAWAVKIFPEMAGQFGAGNFGPQLVGCMDPEAMNYNPDNEIEPNNACMYQDEYCSGGLCGCTDPSAMNYDSSAIVDDGSCRYDTTPPPADCRRCDSDRDCLNQFGYTHTGAMFCNMTYDTGPNSFGCCEERSQARPDRLGGGTQMGDDSGTTPKTRKDLEKLSDSELIRLDKGLGVKPKQPSTQDCREERALIQRISSLPLDQMLNQLNNYLSTNEPCLNITLTFNGGGPSSRNHCTGECGDINSDGLVNILDIVILINIILHGDGDDYDPCGDVNGDGLINILDIVGMIDAILNDTVLNNCPAEELGDYSNSMLHKSGGTSYCKPCDNSGGSVATGQDEAEDPRFCCAFQDPSGDGYHDVSEAIENMGDYVALPGDDCVFVFGYTSYDCYTDTPPHVEDGCMDTLACNYDSEANFDDGSCWYAEENYDCEGNCIGFTCWDGACVTDAADCSEDLCQGLIGCDDYCYYELSPSQESYLPDSARWDVSGNCGTGIYNCNAVCDQFGDMGSCDGNYACYTMNNVQQNEFGEWEVVVGTPESTPCMWDWGDEICMYGGSGQRGGSVKNIVK